MDAVLVLPDQVSEVQPVEAREVGLDKLPAIS